MKECGHKKLGIEDRRFLSLMLKRKESLRGIAKALERSVSTISDELRRNGLPNGDYVAETAQYMSDARKRRTKWRQPLKDSVTYGFVLEKLREGWSPEQVAGRLRLEHGRPVICHETIYRFIYSRKNQDLRLWEYLPWRRARRRRKMGRGVRRIRIPQRISISQRPVAVNQRRQFGHWEGDTVLGLRSKTSIHTEVERVSRYFAARLVARTTAEEAIRAQRDIFGGLPLHARRSTTLDNGSENSRHFELNELGMRTYFADPYSAWQRGSNEHHNGLLRRYLPKRSSFDDLCQDDLDDIVWEINNRPRKVLGYKTSQEVMDLHLGVRIQLRM